MFGFQEVVAADFEFVAPPGERPNPVCVVAHELRRGRRFRLWWDQLGRLRPYATGPDVCVLRQRRTWLLPRARLADAGTDSRPLCRVSSANEWTKHRGRQQLGALAYFGLDGIGSIEKEDMRALVMRGGSLVGGRGRGNPRLLRKRCFSARSAVAGHVAQH